MFNQQEELNDSTIQEYFINRNCHLEELRKIYGALVIRRFEVQIDHRQPGLLYFASNGQLYLCSRKTELQNKNVSVKMADIRMKQINRLVILHYPRNWIFFNTKQKLQLFLKEEDKDVFAIYFEKLKLVFE